MHTTRDSLSEERQAGKKKVLNNGSNEPSVWAGTDERYYWHPYLVEPPDAERLTIRRPSDILKMRFSDNDLVLKNGYLTKGDPLAICGPPGVGKSRLVMQLIIALLTGREFSWMDY
jgi:predicted ATP-dependent serine protease